MGGGGIAPAENLTALQRRWPVHVFVDRANSFLATVLIREIDWPHHGAIDVQFENIGASVMPGCIELPT